MLSVSRSRLLGEAAWRTHKYELPLAHRERS